MKIQLSLPGQYCAGLGDCLTWAWLAAGADRELEFVAGGSNAEMLRLFSAKVTNNADGAADPSFCYRTELNLGGRHPRTQFMQKILGFHSTPKRPKCILDPQRRPKPKRVILAPQCHYTTRTWPPAYWIDLNWMLQKAGYEVVWQLESDNPQFSQRGPSIAYWGHGFPQIIDLFMTAELIVGNDSMPAHLGGTLGIPTLALMGPTRPTVFSHIPDVTTLQTDLVDCVGCHFQMPFRVACDSICQALHTLLPSKVFAAILQHFQE